MNTILNFTPYLQSSTIIIRASLLFCSLKIGCILSRQDNIITHICRSSYNGANHPHTQTRKKKFVRPIYFVGRDKTQTLYDVNGRYI